jgi:hypothetical protein
MLKSIMDREYRETKRLYGAADGTRQRFYFEKSLDLKAGMIAEFQVCDIDYPERVITFRKVITVIGTSLAIYVDRRYGLEIGNLYVISFRILADSPTKDDRARLAKMTLKDYEKVQVDGVPDT